MESNELIFITVTSYRDIYLRNYFSRTIYRLIILLVNEKTSTIP